ncbi:pyridoxal-phosphate dependent enzyme [Thermoactinomyces mirandus]|uniref:threonine ammonia-lyase n=1 Tax=Thermoactinomyces mirandus TaxID=2756294 RepID=A0A7W2AQ74_9BACL|nr:pyridoxal-phosphate dependent enzyme [Thermoactinomyces mirandus]MBA4601684.1 pyridoxal-phosphate dependent enzyme [Thermoactinomyces mirandus]
MKLPISFEQVVVARKRIQGNIHPTPVITSRTLDEWAGCKVFLKCENLQRTGSFKFRGAYHAIGQLTPEQKKRGIIAFSSGNHAQATALAARLLGVPAVISMPADAPQVKIVATRGYGAETVFYNRFTEDREEVTRRIAEKRQLTLIPPYNHPDIMAGAGTAAMELLEQVSDLGAVITPVGGGGLLSGTAVASKRMSSGISVFGVEPENADDTRRSLLAGRRLTIPAPETIADGLRITTPGELTFPVIQSHVDDIVTVSEKMIKEAVRFAIMRLKLVIEPSGAVPLAALLDRRFPRSLHRVGVIVSGGNMDPAVLARLLE